MKRILVSLLVFGLLVPCADARRRVIPQISSATVPTASADRTADRWTDVGDNPTSTITLTSGVSVGARIILTIGETRPIPGTPSITDSRGNTYTIDKNYLYAVTSSLIIVSSPVTTALQVSDTITITWGGTLVYNNKGGVIFVFTGTSSVDQTAQNDTYGTAVSASASTTATNTALVGIVGLTTASTYGSSSWTVSGAVQDFGGAAGRRYYVYKTATSSGAQDPGGTLGTSDSWGAIWVAYK